MSYQREDERYWTDYLRVALPIVGLLLLVGLLWFWLASIIGDDNNDEPTATPNVGTTVIAAATATATQTPLVEITTTTGPAGPTTTTGGPEATEEPAQPTEEEGGGDEPRFAVDQVVVTNDPDVNLRSEPTSSGGDATVLITLPETGTELIITGAPEIGDDDLTWWPVDYPEGEITDAYVADQYIDAEPEE